MTITLTIKVIPQSGRLQLAWDAKRGLLKCFLKSAPEKNKANDELLTFLRKSLGIPREDVAIIGGHTSRTKRVRIQSDLSEAQIYERLGVDVGMQQSLL